MTFPHVFEGHWTPQPGRLYACARYLANKAVSSLNVYEKVRTILSDNLTHDELRGMLARSAEASDWLDPAMDIYDEYDKHR
jgi:hypothetical protein